MAGVLLALGIALAQQSGLPVQFREARHFYYEGADGDKKAYDEADVMFTNLYRQQPNTPQIKVYYGSLRLLEASRTWALWKKNSLSKQGILLMDSAVSAAPDDLEVRFVRAATTFDLPSFFHRREQSQADFALLASRAAAASKEGKLEPRLAAASLYYHAEFLRDDGKKGAALEAWKEAIQIAPESRAARDSRQEMQKLGS